LIIINQKQINMDEDVLKGLFEAINPNPKPKTK
jgi:hypothetical protein